MLGIKQWALYMLGKWSVCFDTMLRCLSWPWINSRYSLGSLWFCGPLASVSQVLEIIVLHHEARLCLFWNVEMWCNPEPSFFSCGWSRESCFLKSGMGYLCLQEGDFLYKFLSAISHPWASEVLEFCRSSDNYLQIKENYAWAIFINSNLQD